MDRKTFIALMAAALIAVLGWFSNEAWSASKKQMQDNAKEISELKDKQVTPADVNKMLLLTQQLMTMTAEELKEVRRDIDVLHPRMGAVIATPPNPPVLR